MPARRSVEKLLLGRADHGRARLVRLFVLEDGLGGVPREVRELRDDLFRGVEVVVFEGKGRGLVGPALATRCLDRRLAEELEPPLDARLDLAERVEEAGEELALAVGQPLRRGALGAVD